MELTIDRSSCVPIYRQISREIEKKIRSKELPAGFKLPAERRLAEELSVHRNTVIKAYNALIASELVVVSRAKPKGYFVKEIHCAKEFNQRFFPLEKAFRYEFRHAEKKINNIYYQSEAADCIAFDTLIMDRRLDPVMGMAHVAEKIFNDNSNNYFKSFDQETEHLKENICSLLSKQNIHVSSKNIQLLSESNQIISYLIFLYLREGDCIAAEGPMVPDNYNIFYNRGIRVITVPMEEDGMRMDVLEEVMREKKPKFIYTLPNYHNPTGITMSLKKRETLLRLATAYNIPIIEEDYQMDFTYDGPRLPSLYTLDTNRQVIYLYSFTLIFPYMIKIGYAVGPPDLIEMLGYAVSIDETTIGGIGQYFLNEYIDSGQYEAHVRLIQKEYRRRRNAMCEELDKIADKGISYLKPGGGLLLWCTLTDDINERRLYSAARKRGVLLMPGWMFYEESHKRKGHIRLSFSNVTETQIRKGIRLLGEALDECRNQKQEKEKERETEKGR